ncbi:MAG TPA: DUF1501 domain-containing protein [Chthonomonadaceae bacterium]|nr:DUF1501 domain-containing protein [Chthonomonadaceae bacterium]
MERQRILASHIPDRISRRDFLYKAGAGFGALALSALLAEEAGAAEVAGHEASPLAGRIPHFPATAKSVIWLFMEGGPSHIDLFDPKPELVRLAGQPLPPSFGRPITAMGTANNALMPTKRTFQPYGQSRIPVSDWYTEIAQHVDKMTVLRSCWADGLNHVGSVCQMNTGAILAGRPSMGAWVQYGLGTANRDLPAFVVLLDDKEPIGGTKNWSSGFLPAAYQGTQFRPGGAPILDVKPPAEISDARQRGKLDFLAELNRRYNKDRADDTELEARIDTYELAFRMQSAAPEAVDLSKETEATKQLYGLDREITAKFGANCLMARRLVERGVRFVQLYCGTGSQWDAHADLEGNHAKMCAISDRPIAGMLTDLEARGLLDSTLVIWGGEFGRTPMTEGTKGRDHNPWGFTLFMAGGGAKGGQIIGATDECGLRAIEKPIHVNDIHATILHMMGLDHRALTFLHNGRHERATVNGGNVVTEIFA